MRHLAAELQNVENLPPQVIDSTGDRPWSFRRLTQGRDGDPRFGALASAEIVSWPEGFQRAIGTLGQLEWHPNHEEVFVLEGRLEFVGGAILRAPSYFNHPPFWLHPTVQRTQGAVRLLRHQSEFPAVGFENPVGVERTGQVCHRYALELAGDRRPRLGQRPVGRQQRLVRRASRLAGRQDLV